MTTSTTNDSRCATCGKAAGTFTCRGCLKDFCLRHTNEHRQELIKQIDEDIIPLHDQLRHNFFDEQTKKNDHPLIKQIDEWEQVSIEKIHQAANDARKQLLNVINKHKDKIKETFECLTQQLKKARDDDDFFENDMKDWLKKLEIIKKDLITPQSINIRYDYDTTSFISKIFIDEMKDTSIEYFEQAFGNIIISDQGKIATHNHTNSYASVRGKSEYTSGQHRLRFQIQHLSDKRWVFFGIVYKDTSAVGYGSIGLTAYGFSGENNIWHNGASKKEFNGYRSDFEPNDIIELLINCDQRTIRLINERTRRTHILDVDITNCPFPWKLTVGLYHSIGECIRIL